MAWMVVACLVGDESEAVQGVRLTFGVVVVPVQGGGGVAVVSGGVEVAQARGVPAHLIEPYGFPHRPAEGAVEVESASGVVQGPPVVSSSSPG
ncbi:hypothetical protein ACWEIJ_13180 [Lentzea sp. NPDC004789]